MYCTQSRVWTIFRKGWTATYILWVTKCGTATGSMGSVRSNAIRVIRLEQGSPGSCTTLRCLFWVLFPLCTILAPKKTRDLRTMILNHVNLRPAERSQVPVCWQVPHGNFDLYPLGYSSGLVEWMLSLGLKDANLHVPISAWASARKFSWLATVARRIFFFF